MIFIELSVLLAVCPGC